MVFLATLRYVAHPNETMIKTHDFELISLEASKAPVIPRPDRRFKNSPLFETLTGKFVQGLKTYSLSLKFWGYRKRDLIGSAVSSHSSPDICDLITCPL